MKFTISTDRTKLTIVVTTIERRHLRKCPDIQSDLSMYDFLEQLTCNSELQWIPEGVTGDLTSAPMLGIMGQSEEVNSIQEQPILERWAFMDYQVRSVLEDLRDKGEAVFVGGPL